MMTTPMMAAEDCYDTLYLVACGPTAAEAIELSYTSKREENEQPRPQKRSAVAATRSGGGTRSKGIGKPAPPTPTKGPLDDLLQKCQAGENPTLVMKHKETGQRVPFTVTSGQMQDNPTIPCLPGHEYLVWSGLHLTAQIPLDDEEVMTGNWTPAFDRSSLKDLSNKKAVML